MTADRWIALVLLFLIGGIVGYFCKFTIPRRCPGCNRWGPAHGYLYWIFSKHHHFWHPHCWNKQKGLFPQCNTIEVWTKYEIWLMKFMDRFFPGPCDQFHCCGNRCTFPLDHDGACFCGECVQRFQNLSVDKDKFFRP